MIANALEMEGALEADGRLVLHEKPALPLGRVRVALRPLEVIRPKVERLPDVPRSDDSISAPLDLPHPGNWARVRPRAIPERLPEVPASLAEEWE